MKEYVTSRTYCYKCENPFALTVDHAKNYDSSGLCPECFNMAMEEMGRDAVVRGAIEKLLNIYKELEAIIDVLKDNKEWRL